MAVNGDRPQGDRTGTLAPRTSKPFIPGRDRFDTRQSASEQARRQEDHLACQPPSLSSPAHHPERRALQVPLPFAVPTRGVARESDRGKSQGLVELVRPPGAGHRLRPAISSVRSLFQMKIATPRQTESRVGRGFLFPEGRTSLARPPKKRTPTRPNPRRSNDDIVGRAGAGSAGLCG